ncbi:HWE histidine kinase domain-containing protein [Terricaulis sp.]|uniref:HWE histidine kinase domain-containing protein n=1 Tax=Terricaulis sp. TaxID=2768686 RepID=UPI003782DDBF
MNQVDLTNCDREPIHILGAIQPFGFLLAISADWMVRHASANATEMLGARVEIGAQAQSLLGEAATASIRRHIQRLRDADSVERIFSVPVGAMQTPMDLALHHSGGSLVIEGEPTIPEDEFDAASVVRATIGRLQQRHRDVVSMSVEAARQVRALTGFDRVMVYRFDEDGAGEVIAEAARSDLEKFLGLHYPASDIPQQARALYLRNWLRIIPDIGATPSQVTPYTDADGRALDLSYSKLRAVSPIHIEYLQNMGVGASMSVSILSRGKLWGMFACHHYSPRRISYARRTAAELYGQMFSLLLESQEREAAAHFELNAQELHNRLMGAIASDSPPFEVLSSFLDDFCEVIACDGVGVTVNGKFALRGAAPDEAEFTQLIRFLNQTSPSRIYATHELQARYEPAKKYADKVAGVLAVPISRTPRDYLIFFRKEIARTVSWAGDPAKSVTVGPHGDRLTPRKSFEIWRETVRGQSTHFTAIDARIAESLRITMLEVILRLTDAAERERKAAQDRQELLIAELNHRVRNILTLIRGLVGHSRAGAGTLDEFAKVLNDRIHALSRAHDQITRGNWAAAPLEGLFQTEVAAYLGPRANRIQFSGPPVLVAPHAFATLALVAHELVTNSAKYGALKDSHGAVKVDWHVDDTGCLVINWAERGGPPVQAPSRRGFGSTVIERSIPYDLQGEAEINYALAGVEARFVIPAAFVQMHPDAQPASPGSEAGARMKESSAKPNVLRGRALLVEDNLIIALDAEEMLIRLGAQQVEVAASVRDALAIINRGPLDFAVLDVNLVGETSFPIAEVLQKGGIPFVFATGYGDDLAMPKEFKGVKIVTKPYEDGDVGAALRQDAD